MAPSIQRSASRLLGSGFSKFMSFVISIWVYHEEGVTERIFCGKKQEVRRQKSEVRRQNSHRESTMFLRSVCEIHIFSVFSPLSFDFCLLTPGYLSLCFRFGFYDHLDRNGDSAVQADGNLVFTDGAYRVL